MAVQRRADAAWHPCPAERLPRRRAGREDRVGAEAAAAWPAPPQGRTPRPRRRRAPPLYPSASVVSPSDPSEHALEAFAQVVANLGWREHSDRIVFAHTHQPLADVRSSADSRTRYWNTGSWIYEPDRSSRQAYDRYLRFGWPGTAVVIDDAEPEPRLLELLADLNPRNGGPGLPAETAQRTT